MERWTLLWVLFKKAFKNGDLIETGTVSDTLGKLATRVSTAVQDQKSDMAGYQ